MPKATTKEQRLSERYDKVFWLCRNCQSRMKRGFLIRDHRSQILLCPLCHSPDIVEDGRNPGKIR